MTGRIVVLISGSGTNMLALADACASGDVPGTVVAVLADRDCKGLVAARERGLTTDLVEPADHPDRDAWSEALRASVARHEPDLVVSAGFMRLLSPIFVDAFEDRLINLHPSLLPAFPGAHAVRDALQAGVDGTGSTVHFIDHEVDHGPVICGFGVPIRPGDTEDVLHERIKKVEHQVLPLVCRAFLEGAITRAEPQLDDAARQRVRLDDEL